MSVSVRGGRTMRRGIIRWCGLVAIFWTAMDLHPAMGAEVKIGALFPFSGPMALLGEETFRGAEVARELVNEKGGVAGQKVVYVKADAPDATAAVSEAERLITVEQVKVILGSYSSSLSYAASEVAERNRVIYWEQGAIADPITERGFRYLFRTLPRASQFGILAAEYAANVVAPRLKLDPKKMTVGIIFEDTLYGTTVGSYAQRRAKELGLKVVAAETYSQKSVDLSPIVLKLKALKPDVIIATQYISDGILFWRQAKELGLNVKAMIGTGAAHGLPDFVEALGDDANFILDVDPAVGINQKALTPRAQAELREFQRRFQAKYGRMPAVHATLGYVGAMILLRDVLPKAGGLDPEKIREAALKVDIPEGDTVMGWGVKFAGPDHKSAGTNLRAWPVMMQWQERKLHVVYPEKLATRRVILPLPTWEERKKK